MILHSFTLEDTKDFYSILSSKEVNTYLPWFVHTSLSQTEQFIKDYYLNQPYAFALCLKENNQVIGYMKVDQDDSCDFGYCLDQKYWHQGYVSEAGKALIEWLKTQNVPYITATHDKKNIYSGKVMEKLGMKYQYSYEEMG